MGISEYSGSASWIVGSLEYSGSASLTVVSSEYAGSASRTVGSSDSSGSASVTVDSWEYSGSVSLAVEASSCRSTCCSIVPPSTERDPQSPSGFTPSGTKSSTCSLDADLSPEGSAASNAVFLFIFSINLSAPFSPPELTAPANSRFSFSVSSLQPSSRTLFKRSILRWVSASAFSRDAWISVF